MPKKTRVLPGPPLDPEADEKSRRRARKWWWVTGIVVVGMVVWVFTTGGEQDRGNQITAPVKFCKAADHYEKTAERQHADGNDLSPAEVRRQVELVEAIVETAPRKVRADAETFLAELSRAEASPSGKELDVDPSVERAIKNVEREFAQGCGIYAREGL